MSLIRQALILAALVAVGIACDGSTGPRPEPRAETSVVVQDDTLIATVTQYESLEWVRFTIPVAIHNGGPAAVQRFRCAYGIEAETGDAWQGVYSPLCSLELVPPEVIAPGQTRQLDMLIHATLAGPGAPKWRDEGIDGTYRVAMLLTPVGAEGAVPMATSNPFVLVVEP